MNTKKAWIVVLFALGGTGICIAALVRFLTTIVQNQLPWGPDATTRDHYLAVGNSYSQGFIVGFFLCFFLAVAAAALSSWSEQRRVRGRSAALTPLGEVHQADGRSSA